MTGQGLEIGHFPLGSLVRCLQRIGFGRVFLNNGEKPFNGQCLPS